MNKPTKRLSARAMYLGGPIWPDPRPGEYRPGYLRAGRGWVAGWEVVRFEVTHLLGFIPMTRITTVWGQRVRLFREDYQNDALEDYTAAMLAGLIGRPGGGL